MREITFRLAAPLVLPNRNPLGKNWRAAAGRKKTARHDLALEVMSLIGPRPEIPFRFATIQVWRHSVQECDTDNLYASLKPLCDVLQPSSRRHPDGLGVIENDKASQLYTRAYQVRAPRRCDQHTRVVIREVSEAMFSALTLEKVAA